MAILASLPSLNLFSNLPSTPPPPPSSSHPSPTTPPQPPIPIPKYPPPHKSSKYPHKKPPKTPAFKTHHHNSKYHKPIKPGQVISSTEDNRSVVIGESGLSYRLPGAPFEFQFSYSETPKAQPLAIREPAFLPFAPPTMPRPWTGKAPLKKSKKNTKLFEPLNQPENFKGAKHLEMLRPYQLGKYPNEVKSRGEVLGKPLTKLEIIELVRPCLSSNRQVNLGRDGLTHNMLDLVHTHWRRQPVCKVRCLGVPTVDISNVCRCLEEKTGGKIIRRLGGVLYLFRGRNYDYHTRPQYPIMLWKPAAPVYPKLIQEAPEGLTKAEADELRNKGKALLPICKLAKNGVYISLVKDVQIAFEGCHLVKIDCKGMHASDYKKIGAKLKELVPCMLLSFDDEQILMWRGKDWKSLYQDAPPTSSHTSSDFADGPKSSDAKTVSSSPKMLSLWNRAIESSNALLLEEISLGPVDLLKKVEEFESVSQATVHSYPAVIFSGEEDSSGFSRTRNEDDSEDDEYEIFDHDYDDKYYINDSFEGMDSSVPFGSLHVDEIAKQLDD